LRDDVGDSILAAEVSLNGGESTPERQDLFGRFMWDLAIDADDIAAGLGKGQGHSLAQPGVTSRHDGDLTRQVEGVKYHMHLCLLIYAFNHAVFSSIEGAERKNN
jgi:hypothetical protein